MTNKRISSTHKWNSYEYDQAYLTKISLRGEKIPKTLHSLIQIVLSLKDL